MTVSARGRRSTYGSVARAERVGTRWRDVQWIDFTSDPDSGSPPDEAVPARAVPELGAALRRFSAPVTSPPAAKADAIPGLARRFTRLPVRPLTLVAPEEGRAAASEAARPREQAPRADALPAAPRRAPSEPRPTSELPPKPRVMVVHPRLPPAAAETIRTPRPAPGRLAAERPFPASISTPVSTSLEEPAPVAAWRVDLTERFSGASARLRGVAAPVAALSARGAARAGTTLRAVGGSAAAMSARGLVRARIALQRPPAAAQDDPFAAPADVAPAKERIVANFLTRAAPALDRIGRFVAARENRLRVSGMIALMAVMVALLAYGGGALLASLTGAKATPSVKQPPALEKPTPMPTQIAVPTVPPSASTPPTDPAARAAFYMVRAKAGDAAAQYDVGVLYARGDGLVQDYASAASWFHAAAAQGNIAAQYNLGVLYTGGLGVEANQTEALNWYRGAADQNHPGAQFNLALAYAQGNGVKPDLVAAARWYQRAAQQGLVPAMVNLAILYEQGSGVDKSLIDAYAWYAAAGDRGDTAALDRSHELFQSFGDRDKARAQGLAATIGAALDAVKPAAAPPS